MKLKDKVFGLGQSLLGGVALALIVGCSASPTTPEISHDGLVLQDDTKFGLSMPSQGSISRITKTLRFIIARWHFVKIGSEIKTLLDALQVDELTTQIWTLSA